MLQRSNFSCPSDLHFETMKRKAPRPTRIALALSGGGPLGAIYEIGALCALQESLNGIDFTRLQHYVGVSAGGFITAALANGITPRALCTSFIENDDEPSETFDPSWLLAPAYGEFARRAIMLPGLLASALWHLTAGRKSFVHALERLGPALPISKAVQASSALPGLFPPVGIDDSFYVDGALTKTMHASIALDEGIDLMLCLNPLVPFDATVPQVAKVMRSGLSAEKHHIPRIVDGGLPAVMSQTFRSMTHSRMVLGMKQYERSYPDTDIILIEPDHRDPELYLANTFSYAQRRHLAEHAYQQTRHMLRSHKTGLSAKLWRHGITLHHEALDDPKQHLSRPLKAPTKIGQTISRLQEIMLDLGHIVRSETHKGHPTW
jgi:predicted acylesterase/phospholipase RssA